MTTGQAVDTCDSGPRTAGHIDMSTLEAQMLSHLLNGDMLRAILSYHDAMEVDVTEARAVAKVLAGMHGIRCRRV